MKLIKIVIAISGIAMIYPIINAQYNMKNLTKKVNIWDTYVKKKDGTTMHFDIVAPVEIKDTNLIYSYGKSYLKTKGQEGQDLSAKQCNFCHIEVLKPKWEQQIEKQGYFIIEMEGCN